MLHLVDVALHVVGALERRGQGQLQPQPGQGRAQVVADRGQQGRALLDMALDPVAHGQEGGRGLTHLARAVRLEPGLDLAAPEGFRRLGQPLDGADLVADEQDRHRHQQHRRQHQPQHEDMGLGRHRPLARRDDAQHTVGLLHLDVDIGGIAGRIEPEGLVQPGVQRLLQRAVDDADRTPPLFCRQGLVLDQGDGQLHRTLSPVGDDGQVLRRRIGAVAFGRPGDVAGQPVGQARGHPLPVGVEEGPGHRPLHDQDRRDDDQQRPPPKRRRHAALQEAAPDGEGREPHEPGPGHGCAGPCARYSR
jgi:hypothetical protein